MASESRVRVESRWWAVEWNSKNKLDGRVSRLQWGHGLELFRTRLECRELIEERYGYIRKRPDLRREPHGWRMPIAVRVGVGRIARGK
jgi:hypothetical protein